MNERYQQLVTFLNTDALANTNSIMCEDLKVFDDVTYIDKDKVYHSLIRQSPFDDIVQTYLEVSLPSLGEVSARLFKQHLPGGELHGLDSNVNDKSKGTPKTSCGEHIWST